MTTKQILYSLGILIVLGFIAAFLASFTKPVQPVARETHVLPGALTDQGDYLYAETKEYYTIKAAYPATTSLDAEADLKARAAIEQGLAQEIADFKRNNKLDALTPQDVQIQNLSADHQYALDMEYKAFASPSTVSYAYQVYADTLGAHPNTYYKTFVFDRQGNQLALADLFVASSTGSSSGYLKQLSDLATSQVKDELARRMGAAPGESFFVEGLAPKPDNFENFVIDGNDLVFLIPPYQVAAYAAGAFEVRIPLSQLSAVLKPGV